MPFSPRWLRPAPASPPRPALSAEVRQRAIDYPLGSGQAEEIALMARLKPAFRQSLRPEEARQQRERFEARGFKVGLCTSFNADEPQGGRQILLVTRAQSHLDELLAAEQRFSGIDEGLPEAAEAALAYGRLLGYPRCCAEAFAHGSLCHSYADLLIEPLSRTEGAGFTWLNVCDLSEFHLIPWVPCSFRCEVSRAYTGRMLQVLEPRFSSFLRRMSVELATARLILSDHVQLSALGAWSDGALALDRVWPTARSRHPGVALSPDDERDTIRALGDARAARRVEARGGQLWLDGEPWAEGLLARFSA